LNFYYCFLFVCLSASLSAQGNAWSIQFAISPGKLIKHSEKMDYKPTGFSQFVELNLTYHTQGKSDWENHYNLPRMGLGLRYLDLGQPSEILGNGYAFFPFIDFGFFEKQKSSLRFMIGCGLAYLDKIYHIKYNSHQTAIGSHWNNLTSFQFRYEHQFYKTNFLFAGISLSHISNGAYQAPNLGLNFVSAKFGYSFHLKQSASSVISSTTSAIQSSYSKYSWSIEYGMTLKEGRTPGGPKFLIQWYMLDAGYQYNGFKSWRLGFEIENNNLDSYFSSYSETRENKKAASSDGLRINSYLAHQWLFGNIGLTFRTGYEFKRNNNLDGYPIATKLDLCYVMPFQLISHVRPYLGFSLKAHLDTAEYIGVIAGLRFHKKKTI